MPPWNTFARMLFGQGSPLGLGRFPAAWPFAIRIGGCAGQRTVLRQSLRFPDLSPGRTTTQLGGPQGRLFRRGPLRPSSRSIRSRRTVHCGTLPGLRVSCRSGATGFGLRSIFIPPAVVPSSWGSDGTAVLTRQHANQGFFRPEVDKSPSISGSHRNLWLEFPLVFTFWKPARILHQRLVLILVLVMRLIKSRCPGTNIHSVPISVFGGHALVMILKLPVENDWKHGSGAIPLPHFDSKIPHLPISFAAPF